MGEIINQDGSEVSPEVIRAGHQVAHGDSFDLSAEQPGLVTQRGKSAGDLGGLGGLLANPSAIFGPVTPQQADNLRAILVGSGTAAGYKLLSKHIGSGAAAAVSSLLSVYLAEKIIKQGGGR